MSRSTVATRNRRLSCVVLALAVPLLGGQSAPPSLASLDRAFACPETLPSDEARMTSLRGFFDTMPG